MTFLKVITFIDSQTTQHINSPKIQEIIKGKRTTHLLIREKPKIKNVTQPFIYCGRLVYLEHEKNTSKPVHIIFQNIDYDDFTENEDLIDIYLWKPSKIGKTTRSKITKKNIVSKKRKTKYKNPMRQRERVWLHPGQGYYRQQIIEKWGGTCPVTKSNMKNILISSHIVSWSESNNNERLDPENGILLSPNIDSLFDKHLISFSNDGQILISNKIDNLNRKSLNINEDIKIPISDGMIKYLERHRNRFFEIQRNS